MSYERNSESTSKTTRKLLTWALAVLVLIATSLGGAEVSSTEVAGSTKAVGDTTTTAVTTEVVPQGGKISLVLKKDWAITEALQFLAQRYKKNIVPSSKVQGNITVTNLYDVTFEQALNAILGLSFTYQQQGNFINVYTAAEYKAILEDPERRVYEVFTLYYLSAAEAMKMVTPILSENHKIEVTNAAETTFPTGESISSGAGGGDTTAMNDTMIVYDFPENVAEVKKLLKTLDIRPKQVLIEATIMSITLTEGLQFGIDWQTLKGSPVTSLTGIAASADDYIKSAGTGAEIGAALTGGMTVGFAIGDVGAFIRAVEEITDVTVLANPKILAMNKQLGQIYIGKKLGYEDQTTVSEGGTATSQIAFLETGTKLSFRPYIGNDGYIRMDIHPKDSSGELKAGLPQETSVELVTNILVKDGQTIVIGGLFRDTISHTRTQIPILGDIPIIGALFRGKADQIKREEVVVLLTPHIINEPSETDGDKRGEDVSRKRTGAKDELQTFGRGKLAEDYYARAARYYAEGDRDSAMKELHQSLRLRPAYLEAIRLRERILTETDSDAPQNFERVILENRDKQEAPKWLRK